MNASVCMASFNRDPFVLREVLESICFQNPPFDFEVIVTDDGSDYGAPDVCGDFPVTCLRIERKPWSRNPCIARNLAYRQATGDVIIAQSDDVIHQQNDSIEVLCRLLVENTKSFIISTVYGCNIHGEPNSVYTGVLQATGMELQWRHVPLFFLGALWREDLYAIGGDDEDFRRGYAYEDKWFGDCLMYGRGLTPFYTDEVLGHHIEHPRPILRNKRRGFNERIYKKKWAEAETSGVWCSASGPWGEEG